jgi:LmbE family N-acetylglucosaminyl deacetylase
MLRLLCVTAHPDDEASSFGGTLLIAHERGIETYVVCLTSGEAATHRGGANSGSELAAMRRREFDASCQQLGVTKGEVLGFPDGKLDHQNPIEVASAIALRIRTIQPQVVVTFGPEGSVTAHADHGMTSVFTTLAFQWAGRSDRFLDQLNDNVRPWRAQKLYYTTADFTLPGRPPIAPAPASASVDIGQQRLDQKIAAFKMHKSQSPLFELFEGYARKKGAVENYHLAACSEPGKVKTETDLFDGIE